MPRIVRCALLFVQWFAVLPLLGAAPPPSSVGLIPPVRGADALLSDPSGAPWIVALPELLPASVPIVAPVLRPRLPSDTVQFARAMHEKMTLPWVAGAGPHMAGTLVAQTARLDVYAGAKTFSAAQLALLAPIIEQLLQNDEAHFGSRLERRVSLGFYAPAAAPSHGVRGMAYTDQQRAEVFYAADEDVERALTVVAHELAHHLEAQRYGDAAQRRADTMLHEGLATWMVGARWYGKDNAAGWRDRARQMHAEGLPRGLITAETCGANNAYELWASFVDFLIQRYGWEKFDALYRSGRGRAPGSADYQGVLGASLQTLSVDWRAWVDGK